MLNSILFLEKLAFLFLKLHKVVIFCPSLQNFVRYYTRLVEVHMLSAALFFRRLYEMIIRGLPQFQLFSEENMSACGSGESKRTRRKCHTKILAGELLRNWHSSTL